MPNKCVGCGKIHPDDADYLLKGCDVCGSKFFLYVPYESIDNEEVELSKEELKEIEKDIRSIIEDRDKNKKDDVIIMDFESIRVLKPGVYQIDLINLLNQKPIIIKIGEGKYEIDLRKLKVRK